MHHLWKVVRWFLVLTAASLVLSVGQVLLLDRLGTRTSPPETATTDGTERSHSLFDPATVVEPLGRFPANRVVYHPTTRGLMYSGGEVSEDGGRTWRALAGEDGRRVRLLGAARAVPPALSQNGRVLCANVLFDEPGVVQGLGTIAHAVEWKGDRWDVLLPANEELSADSASQGSWPRLTVRSLAYLPDGSAVIATRDLVISSNGRSYQVPGAVSRLHVTSKGALYAAVREPGRFPLYHASSIDSPWLPVAGVDAVDAFTEGPSGAVCLISMQRLGCGGPDQWKWAPLPTELVPEQLASDLSGNRIAVWGRGRLAVRKGIDQKMLMCPLKDITVVFAAWDPFALDAITVLASDGEAYRLKLESVR